MTQQLLQDGVFGDDGIDGGKWRSYYYRQAQWLVLPAFAVVQGLVRQAYTQVAAIALKHADVATDDIVQNLVAAAQANGVANRGMVLPVDPVGDEHRRGHQQLEHAAIGIVARIVVVQEAASTKHQALRALARADDEGGVAAQTPLGPRLRAIVGTAAQLLQELAVAAARVERQARRAFAAHLVAGVFKHGLQFVKAPFG